VYTDHDWHWSELVQAIIVIFVSQIIGSIAMAFNSRAASVYHLGYPAICRAVFGMYGSYYFVGARAALAVVWYGVQREPRHLFLRCLYLRTDLMTNSA
jgi:cytosine/uracil/thiamine/allantoin permease